MYPQTMKEILKKQTQNIFLQTLQKYPQAKKKAMKDSELRALAKDLFDLDEAGGLLDILPAREMPTREDYFLWIKEVINLLVG